MSELLGLSDKLFRQQEEIERLRARLAEVDKVERELADLNLAHEINLNTISNLLEDLGKLKGDRDRYREALEWYALWIQYGNPGAPIYDDNGARARAALPPEKETT